MSIFGSLRKAGINHHNGALYIKHQLIPQDGLAQPMGKGNMFFVDAANGSDTNNGRSPSKAFATIAVGYAALTADQHDTLYLISTGTTFTITSTLTWAKSYTHLIGIGAPAPNSRARITISATATAIAALAITGSGCVFANFKVSQETSLAGCGAVSVTGGRNYFYNVCIQGMIGALAKVSATAYSLFLNDAEENRFERCEIGQDTVVRTEGAVLRLDGSSRRNEFIDCLFKSACETVAKSLVKFVDTAALDRYMLFRGCTFYNFYTNHGAKLNECFTVPASATTHDIILQDCWLIGITEWESGDRGQIFVGTGTAAAATAGVMIAPAV